MSKFDMILMSIWYQILKSIWYQNLMSNWHQELLVLRLILMSNWFQILKSNWHQELISIWPENFKKKNISMKSKLDIKFTSKFDIKLTSKLCQNLTSSDLCQNLMSIWCQFDLFRSIWLKSCQIDVNLTSMCYQGNKISFISFSLETLLINYTKFIRCGLLPKVLTQKLSMKIEKLIPPRSHVERQFEGRK